MTPSLEPKFLFLSYLGLEVTSFALVGLNAFLARPNFPMKNQVGCSEILLAGLSNSLML